MIEYDNYVEDLIKKFALTFSDNKRIVLNKTTNYLLPMLGDSLCQFRSDKYEDFPKCQFRAAFIGDNTHKIYKKNKILLLYKFSGKPEFMKFESDLLNNPYCVDTYDADKFHTMYVFNVPSKYKEDYEKFLNWQPSKFSIAYKLHIQNFYNLKEDHPLYKTIYKKEERFKELEKELGISIPRDLEASSAPYWELEYYSSEFKVKKVMDKILEDGREEF